jgi:hypothetical protein
MKIKYRKLSYYFLFLIIGMSFIVFGFINIAIDINNNELTDNEIIAKAKDLGMVEIKETFRNDDIMTKEK